MKFDDTDKENTSPKAGIGESVSCLFILYKISTPTSYEIFIVQELLAKPLGQFFS